VGFAEQSKTWHRLSAVSDSNGISEYKSEAASYRYDELSLTIPGGVSSLIYSRFAYSPEYVGWKD